MRPAAALVLTMALAGPARAADDVLLRTFGVDDGLPHSTVEELATAADGALWVATRDGLARFDGVAFARVPPPHGGEAEVQDLQRGPDGDIWVAYGAGAIVRVRDTLQPPTTQAWRRTSFSLDQSGDRRPER